MIGPHLLVTSSLMLRSVGISTAIRPKKDSFGGFLPQPPYSSGGLRKGLTSRMPCGRSFGREESITIQKRKQALAAPAASKPEADRG